MRSTHAREQADRTISGLATRREALVDQLAQMQERLLGVARDLEAAIEAPMPLVEDEVGAEDAEVPTTDGDAEAVEIVDLRPGGDGIGTVRRGSTHRRRRRSSTGSTTPRTRSCGTGPRRSRSTSPTSLRSICPGTTTSDDRLLLARPRSASSGPTPGIIPAWTSTRVCREIEARFEQVQAEMAEPDVAADLDRLRQLGKDFAELQEIVAPYRELPGGPAPGGGRAVARQGGVGS